MFYDRKIKYLDYYENGNRVGNGGFAKLEVRDEVLRLELTVKGLHPTDSFERDVALLGTEKESVIGQIHIQNGTGSFRYCSSADKGVGGTDISYSELSGIRIPIGGTREILCQWGNSSDRSVQKKPIQQEQERQDGFGNIPENGLQNGSEREVERPGEAAGEGEEVQQEATEIFFREDAVPTQTQEAPQEISQPVFQETAQKPFQPASQNEPEKAAQTDVQAASQRTSRVNLQSILQDRTEIHAERNNDRESESGKRETHSAEKARTDRSQIGTQKTVRRTERQKEEKAPVRLLEDKWEQLSSIYPHIQPFQDERDYLSLTPSDFVLFPHKFYRAVNNSFLLHGYYNYHHLILARIEKRNEILYYIGVPGNYFEREKQVAIMFGFESFECEAEPAKTGDFGYYMMRTEL